MNRIVKIEKKVVIGSLAIMLAALLWSLDGVFIRPKFYMYPAGVIVFLEHIFGFLVLSPFIFLNWPKIKQLKLKDWGAIVWVSLLGGLIGTLMITKAFFAAVFGEVTFATVVILQKLQPFFAIAIARIVLKEKMKSSFYLWAGVAVSAAILLTFGKTGLSFKEINIGSNAALYAFIAAFAFGSSTVFGKRIVNHLDFKSTTALRFGVTSILAFIFITFYGEINMIGDLDKIHWLYLLLIVFSSGAMAMFIYYYGLKKVSASTATICELFWPFSAIILDYFINNNVLNSVQIFASILLLLAFYKVVQGGKEKEKEFVANVVSGEARGEQLGFPTINLDEVALDIDYGVYSVDAIINNVTYSGLMHFGPKETFSEKISTELFLKEFIFDVPVSNVKIVIKKKIRDIYKFASSEELKNQIKKDVENYL